MQTVEINDNVIFHQAATGGQVNNNNDKDEKQFLQDYPLVKAFLAGSFSGTFSTVLFQPLDLVKTRLQNPPILTNHNPGMVTVFTTILQQEQIRGLWRGMVPSITRCVPGVGLYFCSLNYLQTNFFNRNKPTPLESITMGMLARCMSGVALIPITVVKTRFESGVYGYNSMSSALVEIYKTEGVRGMTCGLIPTLFRDAPFSGLYLMFYTQTKQLLPEEIFETTYASPAHFTCGLTAGVLASIITQPADVLKTKMQLYPNRFNNLWSVTVYVHNKYGVYGYFKGIVPRMLRRTLMAAMAWTVYERISKTIGLK